MEIPRPRRIVPIQSWAAVGALILTFEAYVLVAWRELGEMVDADIVVDPPEVDLDELGREVGASAQGDQTKRRNVEILADFAGREPEGKRRRIVLRFLDSPVEIKGDGRVESIMIGRNRLECSDDGRVQAVGIGEREEIECGLVLRSIGYKGVGLEGLPLDDERGTIPNDHGRVVELESRERVPGQYVVGWIKRGPSGVIGTNKKDAQDTVNALLEDLADGRVPRPPGGSSSESIDALLAERAPDHVTFSGWQAIDQRRGHPRRAARPSTREVLRRRRDAQGRRDERTRSLTKAGGQPTWPM